MGPKEIGQRIIYKTLRKQLKIEQYQSHQAQVIRKGKQFIH